MKKYNIHIAILLVFILSLGFAETSAGQDTSMIFFGEMNYYKDSIDNFKGEIKYYKYKDFPKLKYSKPQIKKWIKNLEQINEPTKNIKYITAAYKNNQPKYIRLVTDTSTFTKEIYTLLDDTVKLEVTGLTVAAPNYSLYIYKNNLLNKYILYMPCSSEQGKDLKINFCPYRKEDFEYYKGTNKIRYITTYYINKLAESERNFKTEYNKSGKQINKTINK